MAHNVDCTIDDEDRQHEIEAHLYPLDVRLPLCRHSGNTDGVKLWIDDPAVLFSGAD